MKNSTRKRLRADITEVQDNYDLTVTAAGDRYTITGTPNERTADRVVKIKVDFAVKRLQTLGWKCTDISSADATFPTYLVGE